MSASQMNDPGGACPVTAESNSNSNSNSNNHDPLHWPARMWIALLIFSGVILLDGLDISMIAVAIPEIQQAFGIGAATAQWLVSAYILAFGGFLLLGGRCADLFGRRRVLVAGLAVFALVSVGGAFATDAGLLIVSRFVKGMAAGFTGPAAMSLLTTTFAEGPARNKAFGIFNLFEASGYSSGLLIGGLLAALNWRYIFVLPIPVAVLLLLAALRYLPPDAPRNRSNTRPRSCRPMCRAQKDSSGSDSTSPAPSRWWRACC